MIQQKWLQKRRVWLNNDDVVVLTEIGLGTPDGLIVKQLNKKPSFVRNRVNATYPRLGVSSRIGAIRRALLFDLLPDLKWEGPDPDPAKRETVIITGRQLEVLGWLCTGKSSQEIADLLFVSKRTIDDHVRRLYDLLQIPENDRVALYRRAVRLGLVTNPTAKKKK